MGAELRVASHWVASATRWLLTPLNQVSNTGAVKGGGGVCAVTLARRKVQNAHAQAGPRSREGVSPNLGMLTALLRLGGHGRA